MDVRTLDHIIVAGGTTTSFAERGLISIEGASALCCAWWRSSGSRGACACCALAKGRCGCIALVAVLLFLHRITAFSLRRRAPCALASSAAVFDP